LTLPQTLLDEAQDSNAAIEVTVNEVGRYYIAAVDMGGGGAFSLRVVQSASGREESQHRH
jgi:hypothetical protein